MTPYAVLPPELWDSILSYLSLPDLEAANLASQYFHAVAQNCLKAERISYRQASKFRADDYVQDEAIPWLRPLLRVLRDPFFASYVEELDTQIEQSGFDVNRFLEIYEEKTKDGIVSVTDMSLIRKSARTTFSDWFDILEHPEYQNEFFDDVERLEQSALLAILMCHLPNLRVLTLTAACWGGIEEAPWLLRLADQVHRRPDTPLHGGRPFCRLQHLKGDVFNCYYGLDLDSIAPFIALPTLRCLETPQNHDDGFDWPEHLPRSNLCEILLDESTIPEEAIRIFAAQALRGPCVIKQSVGWRRHFDTPEITWSRLEVPFEGAKPDEHIVKWLEDVAYP
ncbi:unnamed protein product [Clonostachys byssicola]|uniref:F-box domain-containing protein n=1 Tax=Clonostachys byssicola TaxID=160290 RepID=A0A9N9Y0P9_9HYPO|nr:unnamed protein product [Clonostachys byssicola]